MIIHHVTMSVVALGATAAQPACAGPGLNELCRHSRVFL